MWGFEPTRVVVVMPLFPSVVLLKPGGLVNTQMLEPTYSFYSLPYWSQVGPKMMRF